MGIGSKLKRAVRKIIPNEVSEVLSTAAPFVAPFNPAVAAAMAGIGSFDQTGRIGRSVGAGLGTFALGQGARFLGGAGFQDPSLNLFTREGFTGGFSSPFGTETGIGKLLASEPTTPAGVEAVAQQQSIPAAGADLPADMAQAIPRGTPSLPGGTQVATDAIQQKAGTTLKQFFNAPVGEKVEIAKNFFNNLTAKQKLGLGIGTVSAAIQYLENKALEKDQLNLTLGPQLGYMGDLRGTNPRFTMAKEGGIIGLANGGEPAMEMDYRGGGFIPVGAKERADDVPARLSKNEFVMTADAVRAAGGGSVDLGAQRMYDLMNKLEAQA